jgi:predicted Zn-dependent peptidase
VGGHIDAYTTKEYTGYGVRVLPEHLATGLDLLGDMLCRSRVDAAELELEKAVILEEYKSIEDTPEDYVHDVFARTLWPAHPLGRPVIGRPEVVAALSAEDVREQMLRYYAPARMICAAAGNVDHEALVGLLDAQFGDLPPGPGARSLTPPDAAMERTLVDRPSEQAHFVLGTTGMDENHEERWALRVLTLIAGGGMSSRLFQEVREKRGLCYSIAADATSYREGGMFVVYADTSQTQMAEVEGLVRLELARLAREGVRPEELARAKEQVRTATLLSLDDIGSRMSRLARSLLYHGRVIGLEEILAEIDALTLADIHRVANRLFGDDRYALAAIGPFGKRRRRTGGSAAAGAEAKV